MVKIRGSSDQQEGVFQVATDEESWLDHEVSECCFQDERLGKRIRTLWEA
jgi:hypothetical protein